MKGHNQYPKEDDRASKENMADSNLQTNLKTPDYSTVPGNEPLLRETNLESANIPNTEEFGQNEVSQTPKDPQENKWSYGGLINRLSSRQQ
ncbi:MAG: hypothetical protein EZS28_056539, partial [Streblomastix strix]